ncbi:MAG: sigma-54-dependent Fis family transcriptional regulator [Planctomyces sp.]|nr:sigma-54-dependent Fis family transcriptional regulator [Planctomyces sp.]
MIRRSGEVPFLETCARGPPSVTATVLVIDDDRSILLQISRALAPLEVNVQGANTAPAGLEAIRALQPDVVLLDLVLPHTSGLDLFQRIKDLDRRLPVIFITAGAASESAIEAMRLGAYDYVAKPLNLPQLTQLVTKALETRRLMSVPVAVSVLEEEKAADAGDLFVGRSPRMLEVFKEIGRVAQQNVTVLIRGESGTGKELVARAIYQFGSRATRPFMAVNCAALPDTLLESELFGHEKGAFTSADRRRIGKFEQCNGGTLFLDEVGDMSPLTQGKVLRLLQEQRFERVGSNETIETNVRLVAATNRPLEAMVQDGRFRADLFYRLNVVTISLPPLRERAEDVPLLLQYFLSRARKELDKTDVEGISPDALELLEAYPWPGNIRELQSVVRQCLLKSSGPVIVPDFLPATIMDYASHLGQGRANSMIGIGTVTGHGSNVPGTQGSNFAVGNSQHAADQPSASFGHPEAGVGGDAPASLPGSTNFSGGMHGSHAHGHQDLPSSDISQLIEERLRAGSTNLYAEALEMMEKYLLTRVLQSCGANQSKAAEILGITRGKVRDRIAAFGINLDKNVSIDSPR